MKIILLTDIEINGIIKNAGKELDVSNVFGYQLVQKRKAIDKEKKYKSKYKK